VSVVVRFRRIFGFTSEIADLFVTGANQALGSRCSFLGELMSLRTVTKSALKYIDEISTRELRVVVFVCLTITALNALVFAFRIGYVVGYEASSVPMHRDYSYDLMRLKIELALLVITVALRFRRVAAFCVSVLATIYIEVQYGLWYLDTKRWLREVRVSDFSQLPIPSESPNFAGLYQATPWDFILLVFATALFVWQVRVVIPLITSARRRRQSIRLSRSP
jgi:hypothetical protein